MQNSKPLISVIIPTYNREVFLKKVSIPSVLRQTYPNFELIVVDDHSQDNTEKLIKSWSKKDNRIKYLKNFRKKGVSGARNSGILTAKGEYISFLDSDDEWVPEHLERLLKIMENHSDIDIISAAAVMVNFKTKKKIKEFYLTNYKQVPGEHQDGFYKFTGDLFIWSFRFFICNTLAMLARKKVFSKVLYPENLFVCEDCFLVHALAYNGFSFAFYPKIHRIWYVHENNTLDFLNQNLSKFIHNSLGLVEYYNLILDSFNMPKSLLKFIKKKKSDNFFWNLAYNGYYQSKNYTLALKYFIEGLVLDPFNLKKWKTFSFFIMSLPFRKIADFLR